jgi:hypothetical protein
MSGLSWYKSINGSASASNSHYWDWQPATASITVTTSPILLIDKILLPRLISFSVQNIDADQDANLFLYLGDYTAGDQPSLISYIGHNMVNLELSGKLTGYTSAGSMKVNIKYALRVDL